MRGATTLIKVRHHNPNSIDYINQSEGIWTILADDVSVYGSVHQDAAREINSDAIGQIGEERKIVIRLPLSTDIEYGDLIVLENLNSVLNGTYEVEGIAFTKTHLRAFCRRSLKNG